MYKFHHQNPVNNTLLNNPALLPTRRLDASFGVDYHQASVSRTPHVYVTPIGQTGDQLAQVPAISTPDIRQYSQPISEYGGNAPGNLQDAPNLHVSYTTAPILPTSSEQVQPDAALVNQFLKQHMESMRTTPGFSTIERFPAADTTRNEAVHLHTPRQFGSFVQPFQYPDVNVLHSDQQPQIREYVPSNATVPGATSVTSKLSAYPTSMIPEMNVINQVEPLPGYMDYILRSPQKSEDEGSTRSLTSDDVDDLIKRNEHLWRNADVAKLPGLSTLLAAKNANLDENGKTTAILENELDRYISNIRKLHREHGVQSQEELDHEQNTSGDLLNVTLSEDAQELSAEDKAKKEKVPEEMDRILALASDLVSRTTDSREIVRPAERDRSGTSAEAKVDGDNRGDNDAAIPESKEKRDASTREAEGHDIAASTRNETRKDVATHPTKLERPHKDTKIVKENWDNDDLAELQVCDQEVFIAKENDAKEKTTVFASSRLPVDDLRKPMEEKQLDLVTGEESDIDGVFDTVEELAPWDLTSVQKSVRELCLDDPDNEPAMKRPTEKTPDGKIGDTIVNESSRAIEQSNVDSEGKDSHLPQDTLTPSEASFAEANKSNKNEIESCEKHETDTRIEETESSIISNADQHQEREIDEPSTAQANEDLVEVQERNKKVERQNVDETLKTQIDDQAEIVEQNNEYNVEQGYVEDPSQVQQYEEQQDPNGQYDYGQNVPYESAGNEEYERYTEQGYAQEGQEYVQYVEGQYEQYVEDPNSQQQYQHDPNAPYEQDPNQAYDYSYDQQYDPGQGYEGDPNQAYEYPENAPYDPNQTYDVTYEQEYKGEQQNPEDNVVTVDSGREGRSETEEMSLQKQSDLQLEQKTDGGEDKPHQTDVVDETAQSKKKKDVIKSLLDSDTDTTIEKNVSNTESDFDFN